MIDSGDDPEEGDNHRDAGEFEDEDAEELLFYRILEEGELVAYQDWDSGGPGAGAGRVSVYLFEGRYYGFHDAGMEGPFEDKVAAIDAVGLDCVTDATRRIWGVEGGPDEEECEGSEEEP